MVSNLIFIGPPAVGKTTIAKLVSDKIKSNFIDTDYEITKAVNLSISEFFRINSESEFRSLEEDIIFKLLSRDNFVMATGGGAVLSSKLRDEFIKKAKVIYLKPTSLKVLVDRIYNDKPRPLFINFDKSKIESKLISLLKTRESLYDLIANDIILVNDHLEQSLSEVLKVLGANKNAVKI